MLPSAVSTAPIDYCGLYHTRRGKEARFMDGACPDRAHPADPPVSAFGRGLRASHWKRSPPSTGCAAVSAILPDPLTV